MIYTVVAIFDEVAEFFNAPMTFRNQDEAIRYFSWLCQGNDTSIGKFPKHHHLYWLGDFDGDKGNLDGHEVPKLLISGISIKKEED